VKIFSTPSGQVTPLYFVACIKPIDVGTTIRVLNIRLPPLAQLGAHEDCPIAKVGLYVGSSEGDLLEEGPLKNKAGGRRTRKV
jgi:hypothetical protein